MFHSTLAVKRELIMEEVKVIVDDKVSKNTRPKTQDSQKIIYNFQRIGKNIKKIVKTMGRDNNQQG